MVAQSAQTTSAVATLSGYADANYPAIRVNTAAIANVIPIGRQQHSNNIVAYSGIVVFHTGSGS
jgi:hypothetical protein